MKLRLLPKQSLTPVVDNGVYHLSGIKATVIQRSQRNLLGAKEAHLRLQRQVVDKAFERQTTPPELLKRFK